MHPDKDNLKDLGLPAYRWRTVYAANGTINTSDQRQKQKIKSISYGVADLMKLRPVEFQWKNDTSVFGRSVKLGLLAQEVRKVIPEVVIGDERKENLGIFYSDLIPVIIKAVQEQKVLIDQLEATNAKLQKDQSALIERILALEAKTAMIPAPVPIQK